MRTAARWITEQETGGFLQTEEICTKTEERVMEVIHTKYPDARPASAASMDTYTDQAPELVPVYITEDTVMEVAGRLPSGSGMGGERLSEPPALAPEIRSVQRGVLADNSGLHGVARE